MNEQHSHVWSSSSTTRAPQLVGILSSIIILWDHCHRPNVMHKCTLSLGQLPRAQPGGVRRLGPTSARTFRNQWWQYPLPLPSQSLSRLTSKASIKAYFS